MELTRKEAEKAEAIREKLIDLSDLLGWLEFDVYDHYETLPAEMTEEEIEEKLNEISSMVEGCKMNINGALDDFCEVCRL